ncbi:hypothetical protein PDI70_25660, partial [Escherichia coli]|uniref:hypothetical protein n=1 Tax=Escherichia coli TaxID=562 RepID=UPI0023003F57
VFCLRAINPGWADCRFPTDAARLPDEAARMFADSSAHASSHGFQAAVGSSRVTRQSVSHQVCGRASP